MNHARIKELLEQIAEADPAKLWDLGEGDIWRSDRHTCLVKAHGAGIDGEYPTATIRVSR